MLNWTDFFAGLLAGIPLGILIWPEVSRSLFWRLYGFVVSVIFASLYIATIILPRGG